MSQLLENYFTLVKKILPEKSKVTSVGVDIGSDSCKLVVLAKGPDDYEIQQCAIEPVENSNTAATIKRLLDKSKIEVKSLNTAVFGKGTLIRYIDLPRMSLDELKKSFAFEADKYLPFPQDQIYTDCYILDPKGRDKKMSVLVAAAKKEVINERIQLLGQLGLQTNFISVNALAIANVFHAVGLGPEAAPNDPPEAKAAYALFDMGENVSNLIIFKENLPRFTRDIFIGGLELSKRISNCLGISMSEAKKLKSQPQTRKEEIGTACESVFNSLISEMRLSFDYFITEKNVLISRLYLTGGSSMFEGIVDIFAKGLDIPVEQWRPLKKMKFSSEISSEEVVRNESRLAVALGLSLY